MMYDQSDVWGELLNRGIGRESSNSSDQTPILAGWNVSVHLHGKRGGLSRTWSNGLLTLNRCAGKGELRVGAARISGGRGGEFRKKIWKKEGTITACGRRLG